MGVNDKHFMRTFYFTDGETLWVRVPKNASSSIDGAFGLYDWEMLEVGQVDYENIKKCFVIVRNPFDRLVSCWQNRIVEHQTMDLKPNLIGTSFSNFIREVSKLSDDESEHHFRSQTWFLKGVECEYEVFKLEELNKNWGKLCDMLGKKTKLPHNKKSNRKDYKEYYTPELIELVNKRFNDDLNTFGYTYG
jgi:hypothetical protein